MSSGYDALHDTVALVTRPERTVIELRGPRARRVVNGLVTNAIDRLDEGVGCYAFALTPKGKVVADLRALPAPGWERPGAEEEVVWLDAPAEAASSLDEHLSRYVPPLLARRETAGVERLSLIGPRAVGLLEPAARAGGLATAGSVEGLPELGAVTLLDGDRPAGLAVRREDAEGPGIDLYLPRGEVERAGAALEALVEGHEGARADEEEWEIHRVELGLPRFGAELGTERLAQETGQTERAVSFTKGCYTGQEVVARIHYRGHVNRLLRGLRADADNPLAAGDPLSEGERQVGEVTTAVRSPRLGRIGLGYVRREVEPGTLLRGGGAGAPPVEVIELPFTNT